MKKANKKKLAERRRLEIKKREAILAAFLPPKPKPVEIVIGIDFAKFDESFEMATIVIEKFSQKIQRI